MPDQGPPIPDPTVLTTEQLLREVDRVKELMEARLIGDQAVTAGRLEAISREFDLLEKQRIEQKLDTKEAVAAALISQKEAVKEQTIASERAIAKSEASTTKQLEQLNATFATAIQGVTGILGDVKERVTTMESVKQGGRDSVNAITAFVGFLVTLMVLGSMLAAVGVFNK